MSKNKLSIEDIKAVVVNTQYIVTGTLTLCVLTLQNGFKVVGQSACLDVANFDSQIGEQVAHQNALNKIWELEGYLLAQKLYEEAQNVKG